MPTKIKLKGPGLSDPQWSSATAKPGEQVRAGQPLMTLHTDTPERFERALEALEGGWSIGDDGTAPDLLPLIIDRIAR